MISFKESKNIYLYSENIDMRMGMNKIQIIVGSNFSKMEIRHSVFIFCSNNGKTIKMYYEDDYGSWLLQNRLFEGKFKWPKTLDEIKMISKKQLEWLLEGLEIEQKYYLQEEKVEIA